MVNKLETGDGERGGCTFDSQVLTSAPPHPQRISDGNFQRKVTVVRAEARRARGARAGVDRVGGVDRGLADSPRCQPPSESPGVTWEQGKTREIQGRGREGGGGGQRGRGGESVPSMSSPPGPRLHPSSPSPSALDADVCPAAGPWRWRWTWWPRQRQLLASLSPCPHHRPLLWRVRALAKATKMPKTCFVHSILTGNSLTFLQGGFSK